ncbi:MAG: hypothetical protein Q9187_001073 [Circinaria calcarea]
MKPPKPSPPLNVPESSNTVKVSIIGTTSHVHIPTTPFFEPAIKGFDFLDCPAFSFLIQSSSGRSLLFDLGIRKDWQNLAPSVTDWIKEWGVVITVEKDVAEILEDNGVKRESIEGIIWRPPPVTQSGICARLARTSTSPDTFILMGGDVSHHGGQFRPTEYVPLPQELKPNPLDRHSSHPCPGSVFEAVHWKNKVDEPIFEAANLEDGKGASEDFQGAMESIGELVEVDGQDHVFTVVAYDKSLLGIVEFFPAKANQWKEKGWMKGRWAFLGDFKEAVEAAD